ncbi:hypothetical protein Cgig2_010273 [Carnegiea gigantea]|uniref:Ubiquitin-like protease family profile domain-containing protein n=1 Tax=Carnegiea gigantea TaxID=171969 RepID=A0A9Q1JR88_9CARY|nr:hypothetical protein Cgig2_010273 [Carnegiea gigantea]
MFPRIPYGATWSMQKYMEEVHGMGEYVWAETVWRILVEAIEEMQWKLEGPVSDVQINGFSLLIQVWFYKHTTRFVKHDKGRFPQLASWDNVDHGGRYDAFQLLEGIKDSKVIPMLCPREEEVLVPTVRSFMKTDGFRDYILDREVGVLSYEERLERVREELRAEKGKHVDTLRMSEFWKSRANELEARLKMCMAPSEAHDTWHQPGGDVGVHGREEDATCPTTAHIPGASSNSQNTPTRIVDAAAPLNGCHDVGQAPLCCEPHIQPSTTVEELDERPVDAAATPCREGKVSAQELAGEQQQPELVVGESGALLKTHIGEQVVNIDGLGPCTNEVYVAGDLAVEEGVIMTPTSLVANVERCTPSVAERQKEMKEGMKGADKPCASGDPCEGSVHLFVVDVQPISVGGPSIRPTVEELNKLKLMNVNLYLTAVLTLTEREENLQECLPKLMPGSWLRGLINVVPKPAWGQVFMPLLETSDGHWLLLVADLHECCFLVYDSLPSPVVKSVRELVDSAADGFDFDQACVVHYRDKCLLSFLQGQVCLPRSASHLLHWQGVCVA